MRLTRQSVWLALSLVAALVLAGCGGGGATTDRDTVSIYNTEPENPLIPGDTNESGGSNATSLIWTGLYTYDPNTGKPVPQMVDKLTKTGPASYDIKIKKGWQFHDGTEVTARNYVDAWNYTAYKNNGQLDANYLHAIKGYNQVNPDKGNPTAKTMSGLKVLGRYEFSVTLSAPNSTFPVQLGYGAFDPMPNSFFQAKDKKQWAKHPIGNGPMKFVSFTPNTSIKMTRFDGYKGTNKVKFKNVVLKIYSNADAGYQALQSDQLDFDDTLPSSALIDGRYKKDLDGRTGIKQTYTFGYLGLPEYQPQYKDPNLRKAISLAINRKQIAKQIFHGTRTPADGWVPPNVPGAKPGACGQLCQFNPKLAKQYFAKTHFKGPLMISSNADGGNKEWIEAACNSITKTLGVKCNPDMQASFGQFEQMLDAHQAKGAYRGTWIADYPTVENFLTQLYGTGGSANSALYSNPAFDKKLQQAAAAPTTAQGNQLYDQAEKMLAKDMPVIPLFFYRTPYGWSNKLAKGSESLFNSPWPPGFQAARG